METILSRLPDNRKDFLAGKGSIEIGYPWLTYGAILSLEQTVEPGLKVLELGCGGSTVFFSERGAIVKSIDFNQDYIDVVRARLNGKNNVKFIFTNKWSLIRILKKEPRSFYDLALVDIGESTYSTKWRIKYAEILKEKIKKGGVLVIDNYDRWWMKDFDYTGFKVLTFDQFSYQGRGTRICIKK
jgi:predicted O-methyltransferase YrrM